VRQRGCFGPERDESFSVAAVTGDLPRFEMLWPLLEVVKERGGSATIQEIEEGVAEKMGFSEDELGVLHGDGPRTEISYRLAWCRTYLKYVDALENSTRGVWSITEEGRRLTQAEVGLIPARVHAMTRSKGKPEAGEPAEADEPTTEEGEEWKQDLLGTLLGLEPSAFERLAQRLLREAGFVSVQVTGKSGDGGIDGIGLLEMQLLSFPVFFQCKRYKGSVSAGAIRDFRGAMSGRGDKGLLITTGSFTPDAKREARRAGAPPIDLIDGDRLCVLLREHKLGVTVVEEVRVERAWFDEL
jgi:restriction system protein